MHASLSPSVSLCVCVCVSVCLPLFLPVSASLSCIEDVQYITLSSLSSFPSSPNSPNQKCKMDSTKIKIKKTYRQIDKRLDNKRLYWRFIIQDITRVHIIIPVTTWILYLHFVFYTQLYDQLKSFFLNVFVCSCLLACCPPLSPLACLWCFAVSFGLWSVVLFSFGLWIGLPCLLSFESFNPSIIWYFDLCLPLFPMMGQELTNKTITRQISSQEHHKTRPSRLS